MVAVATTGSFCVVLAKGVELVGDFLWGGEAFFEPADFAARGADLNPAAGALEDDQLFAVGSGAGAVGDSSDAVAEEGLLGGGVDVFIGGRGAEVGAAGERAGEQEAEHEGRAAPVHPLRKNLLHG